MKFISFIMLIGLIVGCGSGKSNSIKDEIQPKDELAKKEIKTIVGYVIDSPVWGLEYICKGQKTKTTNKFGAFECESLPVTFMIGDLVIGHILNITEDKKIYPQDIIGVSRDKVDDIDVVKLTRFLQTLDDDGKIDEVIKIDSKTVKNFDFQKSIDLSTLDEKEISLMLQDRIGKELISKDDAQKHLRKNLVDGKKPTSIELILSTSDIPKGLDGSSIVNGIYDIANGEVKSILADEMSYSSSDASIATVDRDGKLTALSEGLVTISAKYGELISKSNLRVTHTTLSKIEISNPTLSQLTNLAFGRGTSFNVKGFYSLDDIEKDVTSQVVWSSKSPLFSSINHNSSDDEYNFIRSLGVGNASLLATLFDITDKVDFEIKQSDIKRIKINLEKLKIPKGKKVYLDSRFLLGYYEDDSNTTRDDDSNRSESLKRVSIWSSNNDNILEVELYDDQSYQANSAHKLVAKDIGKVILSVKYKDFKDSVEITVIDPVVESIVTDNLYDFYIGESKKIKIIGIYTDAQEKDISEKVIFKSLNPSILNIDSSGNFTALKQGHGSFEIICVEDDRNITFHRYIQVRKPDIPPATSLPVSINLINDETNEIPLGQSKTLKLEVTYDNGSKWVDDGADAYWEIDNNDAVKLILDSYRTYLQAYNKGEVTVKVKLGELTTSKTFKVIGPNYLEILANNTDEIALGSSQYLELQATYSNGIKQTIDSSDISWEVDNNNIAKFENGSYFETLKKGEVTITAKYKDLSASRTFKIVDPVFKSIVIEPYNSTIYVGKPQKFTIIARYGNDTQIDIKEDITWEIMSNIATITNEGIVTGISEGKTRIRATYKGKSTTKTLDIIKVKLAYINAEDSHVNLDINGTAQLKIYGHYNDGSKKEITENLSWLNQNENIATVDSSGKVTAVSQGFTAIRVSLGLNKETFYIFVSE